MDQQSTPSRCIVNVELEDEAERDRFKILCIKRGSNMSEELRRIIREELAEAEANREAAR